MKRISVADNCAGIKINPGEPLVIFGSDKKNDPKTNGTYGMGMFTPLSIGNKMEVETTSNGSTKKYSYVITPEIFFTDDTPEIEIIETACPSDETGTTVTISDFKENYYEELDPFKLKNEIESHFELLLHRNLKIEIITDGRK